MKSLIRILTWDLFTLRSAALRIFSFVTLIVWIFPEVQVRATPTPSPTPPPTTIWHVRPAPAGNDAANGLSWATAFRTIQHACNVAAEGDQIWVEEGTYVESDILAGANLRRINLYGGFSAVELQLADRDYIAHPTIINGRVDLFGTLDGFHITGSGTSQPGGGLYVQMNSVALNCRIYGNVVQTVNALGGGVYNRGYLVNCLIYGNGAVGVLHPVALGGGVYNHNGTILHCTIFKNGLNALGPTLNVQGGGVFNQSGTVLNTILYENFRLTNATISDYASSSSSGPPTVNNSRYAEAMGGTNTSADPLFVDSSDGDPVNWDVHLQPISLCIDGGTDGHAYQAPTDYDSQARILDGTGDLIAISDMGAYEFVFDSVIHPTRSPSPTPSSSPTPTASPSPSPTCTPVSTAEFLMEIQHPAPIVGDRFGLSVAPLGDDLIVGAFFSDVGAADAGVVYLMDGTTGQALLTIPNPFPAAEDRFGSEVAAVGPNILVGAYQDDIGANNAGSAYLFDGVTGDLLLTLNNPFPVISDQFGFFVGSHGWLILVGEPSDDTNALNAGALHVYDGDPESATFGQNIITLTIPGTPTGMGFGQSATIVGNNILVGAPSDDTGGAEVGSAHLFNLDVGDPSFGFYLRGIANPTVASNDFFGRSVKNVGMNHALVSSYADDVAGTDSGAVYLFDLDPNSAGFGALVHTFLNPNPGFGDAFGFSMTSLDTSIAIGAWKDDACDPDTGSVFVFDGDPLGGNLGTLLKTWIIPDYQGGDELGRGMCAANGRVFAGASLHDTSAADAGSVFVFQLFDTPTPTLTPTQSPTESPTETPTETPIPTPSESPTPSPSPTPNASRNWTIYE